MWLCNKCSWINSIDWTSCSLCRAYKPDQGLNTFISSAQPNVAKHENDQQRNNTTSLQENNNKDSIGDNITNHTEDKCNAIERLFDHKNNNISSKVQPLFQPLNIDQSLNLYYIKCGQNNYLNKDGKGKFLQFILDEKLDDICIDDKLTDPNNCKYTKFDENFPITIYQNVDNNMKINNGTKQLIIFYILQHCHLYGIVPTKYC